MARTLTELPSGTPMVRDPHHGGLARWAWYLDALWHQTDGQSKWTRIQRISFTPKRILAIASIIPEE